MYRIYLFGTSHRQSLNVRQEVGQRMQQTMKTSFKLEPVWKTAHCTSTWKLRVYYAIIQNKLVYALKTLHITKTMLRKMDAFHLRGLLRSMLGLRTTFAVLFGPPPQETYRFRWTYPLRHTTFAPNTACTYPTGKRKVGGPRQQWRHFAHRYEGRYGLVDKTHPSCVRPGLNTRVQH